MLTVTSHDKAILTYFVLVEIDYNDGEAMHLTNAVLGQTKIKLDSRVKISAGLSVRKLLSSVVVIVVVMVVVVCHHTNTRTYLHTYIDYK